MQWMRVTGLLALLVAIGCASHSVTTVMVPPKIDLKQHELIGVVEFRTSSEGELGELVTRKFTEAARRDQGLVRMIGLGPRDGLGTDGFKAIGREHDVRTILVGELTVSDIRPNFRLGPSLRSGSVTAQVDATLAVQMIETATGASIWNRSARATRSVGHVSVFGGKDFVFDADDPERAYGELVSSLVEQVTREFRISWQRL